MPDNPSSSSFEAAFRFPDPTPDTVVEVSSDMMARHTIPGTGAVGTEAFFSIPALQELTLDMSADTGAAYGRDYAINPEIAMKIALAGFMNAVEVLAALRLRSSE